MKKTFAILLMWIVANYSYGQPSLSSFTNTTQKNQLIAYIDWATSSLKEKDRLHDQQAKRDSINYVALQLQVNNMDKAYKKALADSMATLLPISTVNATIDSIMKAYKVDFDKDIKALQDADVLTNQQVNIIKSWMDKNFKF